MLTAITVFISIYLALQVVNLFISIDNGNGAVALTTLAISIACVMYLAGAVGLIVPLVLGAVAGVVYTLTWLGTEEGIYFLLGGMAWTMFGFDCHLS